MSKLEEGFSVIGISPSEHQLKLLELYINELEFWNKKLNLVATTERDQLVIRHILDCATAIPVLKELPGSNWADIGSGAGFPGIVLAIFMEDKKFTLVERSGKKAGFLRSTIALLGLVDRVDVLNIDLEKINKRFDVVILRAFREFRDFYKYLKVITVPGGTLAAYKGRKKLIKEEVNYLEISSEAIQIKELEVPFLEEQRHILLINN